MFPAIKHGSGRQRRRRTAGSGSVRHAHGLALSTSSRWSSLFRRVLGRTHQGVMMKHQIIFRAAASATLTMGLLAGTNQVAADPLIDALSQGKVSANIRLRYEGVDDDTRSKDADAVTIRTRLGYQTADFNGWKLFGEIEDVTALDESYNSTVNGKGTYPVVADPEDTEINQLFVSYGGFADTWIKAGRQRIILDGARFVGNVGWRQNEQTYDAFSVVNKSLADTVFTYAYVSEVHR
ncbi:MAG TPA: hypothetical protein DCF45_11740, partial [Gammaproteobacteria bacterium]|nr:hypothetical protein [Gammaproteobacteria bacterium]